MEGISAERLTPVSLAFIGDAVYTLRVREYVMSVSDGVVGTLHGAATKLVNARAQAAAFNALANGGEFSEAEADVARRAKNAHLHSRTKAASAPDYHKATALEAVIGYLYISGNTKRLDEIVSRCIALGSN